MIAIDAKDVTIIGGLYVAVMFHHYFVGNVNNKAVTVRSLFFVIILLITIDFNFEI